MNYADYKRSEYQSYLLRLWREGSTQAAWRVSLQSTANEQIQHFVSLEALFLFLIERLDGDQQVSVVLTPSQTDS